MELQTDQVVQLLLMAALGFWGGVLVQRGIAVFHDGLRPALGQYVEGSIEREQVVATASSLNQLLGVWFIPFTLATGTILTHLLLLPLDLIGVRVKSWWRAGLAGAVFGVLLFGLVLLAREGLAALPVDVITPLFASLMPLVFAVTVIPAVAAAYQFGFVPGLISLVIVLAGHLINTNTEAISPNALALAGGLLALAFFTIRAEMQRRAAGGQSLDMSGLESKAGRVRQNLPWLVVQGALLSAATNAAIFGWFVLDMSAAAAGFPVQAALVALVITIGFLPTVVTSMLLTGVSQMVGLTFVFMVAYLSPNPAIAAAAGAAVVALECLLLQRIGDFLNAAPTVREVGDSVRGALEQVAALALIGGAFMVSEQLLPNGGGIMIVAAIIAMNELSGTPITRMAEGPAAVLVLGIIANILHVTGLV